MGEVEDDFEGLLLDVETTVNSDFDFDAAADDDDVLPLLLLLPPARKTELLIVVR